MLGYTYAKFPRESFMFMNITNNWTKFKARKKQ